MKKSANCHSIHTKKEVLNTLRSHQITSSLVPVGCTGLVQPLDVALNKPLKDILRDILEDSLDIYKQENQLDL